MSEEKMKSSKNYFSRRNIIILFIILFIVSIGLTGFLFANKVQRMHDRGPFGFMIGRMTKDLDLTAEQKTQVESIRSEIKAKMESGRSQRQNHLDELETLFRKDNISKDELRLVMEKGEMNKQEMKEFMLDEMIKFHTILTPAQRNKAADNMKKFKDRMHKFDGKRKRN